MSDGILSRVFGRVRDGIKWSFANAFGERPRCECGSRAEMYLEPEGYRCLRCYAWDQPYRGIGYVRDLRPSDYFEADTDE